MKTPPESLMYPGETAESFIASNHVTALLTDRSGLSFPDLSHPEVAENGWGTGTTLRFIFWMHTPANQQHVIPLIEGCDIFVMEAANREVYKNVIERQRAERTLQLCIDRLSILVNRHLDPKAVKRLGRGGIDPEAYIGLSGEERAEEIRSFTEGMHSEIFVHYAGQFEKIFLVDLEYKDAERFAKSENITAQTETEFSDALINSNASWAQLRGYALDFLKASTTESEFRERVTSEQLDRIVRTNPGKNIAVLYGASHHNF